MPGHTPTAKERAPRFSLGRTTILPRVQRVNLGIEPAPRDRFVAEATIGEGASGVVARVHDGDLGRRVAVKRLQRQADTPGDVARFVREVRLMGSLEHPNIVPVYDVGQGEDDAFYAVMKYVDGETVEELLWRLRDGDPEAHATWDFDARTRLFMDVCRGIAHAHKRGVLHRDVKPGNVMVTQDGSGQILDWGLAKSMEETELLLEPGQAAEAWQTQQGDVFGTPAYMAPEQARGEPYTPQTEVFALGALFWEILTLRTLWTDDVSAAAMVEVAKTRELPVPFHLRPNPVQGPVPSHLSWFVWRATRPDPRERFTSVKEMMDELRARATGAFPVQCPATLQRRVLMRLTRSLDRHPWGFPMVAGASIVAALGGAFLLGAWLL